MEKTRQGRNVLKLLGDPAGLLTTILLCNTFVNVAASSVAAGITASIFPGPLGVGAGVLVMTFLLLVVGEISPKTIARTRNREWSERAAPVMIFLVRAFSFAVSFLKGPADFLDRLVPGRDGNRDYHEAELGILMEMAREEGFIGGEADTASAILSLEQRNCHSAMVPREQVALIMSDWSEEQMRELAFSTTHSAYPVVDARSGRMTGIVHVAELLGKGICNLRKVPYFPESARLSTVLEKLRCNGGGMGAVVDEYGDWTGIITISDILERAVFAGSSKLSLPPGVSRNGNELVVPAELSVEVLATILETDLIQPEYAESCGGLLQELTGSIPSTGEEIHHEGFVFRVLETRGNAVKKILIRVPEKP